MATKKEILAYAKQHGFIYPKIKVIFGFGLLGGMIGLMTVFVIDRMTRLIVNGGNLFYDINIISLIEKIFSVLLFSIIFGTVFGCIPAILTGIYCAIFNFIIAKNLDYLHLYVVGTIFSAIYFNHWINLPDEFWQIIYTLFSLGSIGGISAMICGKLFLPKLPKNFDK
ncbi:MULTISPECIES: hypothetical protein [Moraxella]|uniref:Uncharacterized protein n=1 Tax=Moraxella lacunata TaxID=477 RepID=A0A1B8Q5T8_MORLA|nr:MULTISPECIES: hypothetical protein [Moraxella]MBE9577659.1 hypothetical protein [Moraxella sp. K1664]MBE9587083.1 hypothetical protein [Moraxella sp. K1630]MBE9590457.1 hypothetical protein [Moraxella sp. K127]MBE9595321.1 hypothetical protein [Moraxella sp. K2450]MDI4481772.1 hypothetical protein [Moraxella lacunata]